MDQVILEMLRQIQNSNGDIKLLNIYKGLPISYDASILAISPPLVTVQCNKFQIACILLEKGTYIQCKGSNRIIRSQLYAVRPEQEQAELTNLIYVNGGIGLRSQVRVESDNPVWVLVQAEHSASSVMTTLCDISMTGIGIYLEKFYYQSNSYKPGSPVQVALELPMVTVDPNSPYKRTKNTFMVTTSLDPDVRFNREALRGIKSLGPDVDRDIHKDKADEFINGIVRINSHGIIKNAQKEPSYNRYRIGIQLDLDAQGKQAISQFIAQRQSEIIKEFRLIYASLVGRHIQ